MPKEDIPKIDLERYAGDWNEIASFPAWFQKGCTNTKAKYEKIDAKTVRVINTCQTEKIVCDDNKCMKQVKDKERIGKAFTTDEPNLLKVQFFPLFKAPYRIEYIDPDYQNAVVGSGKGYLWILSRKNEISEKKFAELSNIAKEKGYDITKLQKTIRTQK